MRRSRVCFFGLVATCDVPGTCPTQKLPLFLNLIQMGPRKNTSRISENSRPKRYRANIKLKNRKNMTLCVSTSMPAECWYVPRMSYMCRNSIPNRSLLFILTWGGVWCRFLVLLSTPALLPLAHPGQFGQSWCSRVCVGLLLERVCFNCVY